MRRLPAAGGWLVWGSLVWGCSVYDTALISTSGLAGGGDAPGAGRTGAGGSEAGGSEAQTGGGTMTQAGSANQGGDVPTGGSVVEGGGPSDGGDGAIAIGASAGVGGGSTGGSGGGSGAGNAGAAGKSAGGVGGTSGGTAGNGGNGGNAGGITGGSGGSAPAVKCVDHPISLKSTWVATASSSSFGSGVESDGLYNPPAHMTDGSYNERWSSGQAQAGNEWIQIDFGVVVNLTALNLNVNNDTGDYPRAYAVRISNQSDDFAAPIRASGDGMPGNTVISFPSIISGRYLTVRQTAVSVESAWWTIAEVIVGCTDQ